MTLIVIGLLSFSLHAQDYDGYIGGHFMLVNAMDSKKGYCLDLGGHAQHIDFDANVIAHTCKEGLWKDGTWMLDNPRPGNIYLPDFDLCLGVASASEDADIKAEACTASPLQSFVFRDDGKVQLNTDSDQPYCLGVGDVTFRSGLGLRRQTRMVSCNETDEKYTNWIVPREGTNYPPIKFSEAELANQTIAPNPPRADTGENPQHPYARACGGCHGESAEGYASEFSPKLSGLSEWYLLRQMQNFQNDLRGNHKGERWAKQMNYHVQELTKKQIESFVEYILTLEDTPAPATISGNVVRGKTLYEEGCVSCHRADGMGSKWLKSPQLTNMSDWYMIRQLQSFRADLRGDHADDKVGKLMVPSAKALPDEQALIDVVAYINTLSEK